MPRLTRRDFLRWSGAAAASALLPACGDGLVPVGPGPIVRLGSPRRIVVIGAGLSGLVAAYELGRAGHVVTVLEARSRPGGRVLTIRTPFADGHFVEAGAARIRDAHELVHHYIHHFGLETTPFLPGDGQFLMVAGGERRKVGPQEFPLAQRTKIRHGTERLPEAFAAWLGSRISYEAPVVRVERSWAEVLVTATDGGRSRVIAADRVICTVPFPVLDRIEFTPPLSPQKQRAARELRYEPSVRVYVQVRQRFWEEEGCNGFAVTDWPEEVWHPTWDRDGPRGILLSYLRGSRALELGALGEADRVALLLEHWSTLFPGIHEHVETSASTVWQAEEWSGGAYAAPAPGQLAEFGPHMASPEGGIHFAGEHLSNFRGWMEGALSSGLRAAEEANSAASAASAAG
jgi:monoamine oxidase